MGQLIKTGEYSELNGTLAEVNRLLGQLKIVAHESDLNKVRIAKAEFPQLDGSTLNQAINSTMLRFDGAIINFTSGEIFKADGSTALGTNFTPSTIPASEYLWYGVSLDLGTLNALGEQEGTVTINPAASSNAVAASAPFPEISGTIKRGWVQVQNNGGSVEVSDLKLLGVGSGSGGSGGTAGSSARDAYENRLDFSLFQSVSATVFEEDTDTFIDTTVPTPVDILTDPFAYIPSVPLASNFLENRFNEQGDAWIEHPNYTAGPVIAVNPDSRLIVGSSGPVEKFYYSDALLPASEYEVEALIGARVSNDFVAAGVMARMDSGAKTYYLAVFRESTGDWTLEKSIAGVVTVLDTFSGDDPQVSDREIVLSILDAQKSVTIDGVERLASSDNTITATGFSGVMMGVTASSGRAAISNWKTKAPGLVAGSISAPDNNAFKFSAVGQHMTDVNNATSATFLAAEVDVAKTELFARWVDGSIDSNATYEVSRDGGNEYQAVVMTQVGTNSNAFRGFFTFTEEAANQDLGGETTPNANRELTDTGVGQQRAVQITVTNPTVLKTIEIDLNKIEAIVGNLDGGTYKVQVVRDASGLPSLDPNDLVSETPQLNISAVATGDSTIIIDIPDSVLAPASIIWVVAVTDAGYKAAYVTGVDALSIRVNSLTPTQNGATFNGTTWSAVGEGWVFQLQGREHDLKVRIISGTANVLLESYGIYYHESGGVTADTGDFDLDVFSFSGTANQTVFNLVNIVNPIPGLVEAWDEEQGNALLNGASTYQIVGNSLVFAANYFNRPGIPLTLKVRQIRAGVIDNSDANAAAVILNSSSISDIRNNADKAGLSGGVANAYTLTFTTPFTNDIGGQIFYLTPIADNTGAATLTVDGRPTAPIYEMRGGLVNAALLPGTIRAGGKVQVMRNNSLSAYIIVGGGNPVNPCAKVRVGGSILLGSAATLIPFNTEDYDTNNIHDNAVNNHRLTCNTAGKYLTTVTAALTGIVVSGQNEILVDLRNAGGTLLQRESARNTLASNSSTHTISLQSAFQMQVGDYLEFSINVVGNLFTNLAGGGLTTTLVTNASISKVSD